MTKIQKILILFLLIAIYEVFRKALQNENKASVLEYAIGQSVRVGAQSGTQHHPQQPGQNDRTGTNEDPKQNDRTGATKE